MEGRFAASPSLFHKFVPAVPSEKSCKQDVKQDGRNQTDTTPLTVRGRSRSPPAIQPSYPLGAERARFHYPSCVRLTVLRQLFVCEIYSPFDFKRETGWKQDTRRGMLEKIRGAYAPVPFWITGLLMVFPKTSADGYLPVGLYMVFLRSSQRPHPVTKAPRKPDGLHGDHLPALTKTAILFLPAVGLYKGFLGSLQRPFSGAYKGQSGGKKRAAARQSILTARAAAPEIPLSDFACALSLKSALPHGS